MNSSLPKLMTLALVAVATLAAAQGPGPPSRVPRPLSADQGPRTRDQGPTTAAIAQSEAGAARPAGRLSPVEASDAASTAGERLLLQTLAQLERRKSVTARLRHQVFLDGSQLYGIGTYWQQGSGDDLRVRLELQIAGQKASLLQVSNSRFLWTDRRLPSGRAVTRIDLRKLRADPALAAAQLEEIQPGHASWSAVEPESAAVCGGLPTLLSSLVENFAFAAPQAMRLSIAPPLAPQPINIPVFVVIGHWRPEKLAALVGQKRCQEPFPPRDGSQPPQPDKVPDTFSARGSDELPDRFPQEVLLLVGQADLFPYRVEYRRFESQPRPDGSAPGGSYQLSARPTVVIALSDVAFDAPIAAGQFDYTPGDADWADRTAEFRDRLHRRRQEQMAARSGAEQGRAATAPIPR